MCGRFTLRSSPTLIADVFNLVDPPALSPHFNIAPSQRVAVIRDEAKTHKRELAMLKWGLIPFWADDPKIGAKMANARSKTAATKPSFRRAFKSRRCLIVADGFYERQKTDGAKQPYFIRMKDERPFGIAGLWERWDKQGEPIESCAILTTDANEVMQPIHDRMPVIIPPKQFDVWLDPKVIDEKVVTEMLRRFRSDVMTAYPISTKVNNPKFDAPACVDPLREL
jgi:putative SOS response-associated peptidase YedK